MPQLLHVLNMQKKSADTLILVLSDHETGGMAISEEGGEVLIDWITGAHTGEMVPIFSFGKGSKYFNRVLDNTDIPRICAKIMNLRSLPHFCE